MNFVVYWDILCLEITTKRNVRHRDDCTAGSPWSNDLPQSVHRPSPKSFIHIILSVFLNLYFISKKSLIKKIKRFNGIFFILAN